MLTIIEYFVYLFLIIGGIRLAFFLLRYNKKNGDKDQKIDENLSKQSPKNANECSKCREECTDSTIRLRIKACLFLMYDSLYLFQNKRCSERTLLHNALNDYGKGLSRLCELCFLLPVTNYDSIKPYCKKIEKCYGDVIELYVKRTVYEEKILAEKKPGEQTESDKSDVEIDQINQSVSAIIKEFNECRENILKVLSPHESEAEAYKE